MRLSGERRGFLTHLPIAAGLGLGTSSVVWWASMLLPLASWSAVIGDRRHGLGPRLPRPVARRPIACRAERGRPAPVGRSVAAAAAAHCSRSPAAGVYFVAASVTAPHGIWDAWAIWNARARFLFRGYPDVWTQAFSPELDWSHPDYPLLVPVSVARAWAYIGGERITVPILLAATFCAGIVATAAMSVSRSATAWRGVLTAVMILASPAFLANAVAQCADIPLAFLYPHDLCAHRPSHGG